MGGFQRNIHLFVASLLLILTQQVKQLTILTTDQLPHILQLMGQRAETHILHSPSDLQTSNLLDYKMNRRTATKTLIAGSLFLTGVGFYSLTESQNTQEEIDNLGTPLSPSVEEYYENKKERLKEEKREKQITGLILSPLSVVVFIGLKAREVFTIESKQTPL